MSILQITGVNMSVIVCVLACLDGNLFYRLKIFKGEFVGIKRNVSATHICNSTAVIFLESKEKTRLAVLRILL